MPKEVIYSDSGPFVRLGDGSELAPDDPAAGRGAVMRRGLRVGWSRNQFVEVGVGVWWSSTEEQADGDSHYTSLDREGVNRAIRALRKARDQAYGQDA